MHFFANFNQRFEVDEVFREMLQHIEKPWRKRSRDFDESTISRISINWRLPTPNLPRAQRKNCLADGEYAAAAVVEVMAFIKYEFTVFTLYSFSSSYSLSLSLSIWEETEHVWAAVAHLCVAESDCSKASLPKVIGVFVPLIDRLF